MSTTTAAPPVLQAVATALHTAADGLLEPIGDETTPEALLERLAVLRVVFDATDAGNTAQGRPPGVLAPLRTELYHALADRRVPRERIAEAAGVSANAVGFAMKGQRRGRAAPATAAAPEPERKRKPRPA